MKRGRPKSGFQILKEHEMTKQKTRFARIGLMPQHELDALLCDPCRQRDPWVDICPECWGKIEGRIA